MKRVQRWNTFITANSKWLFILSVVFLIKFWIIPWCFCTHPHDKLKITLANQNRTCNVKTIEIRNYMSCKFNLADIQQRFISVSNNQYHCSDRGSWSSFEHKYKHFIHQPQKNEKSYYYQIVDSIIILLKMRTKTCHLGAL